MAHLARCAAAILRRAEADIVRLGFAIGMIFCCPLTRSSTRATDTQLYPVRNDRGRSHSVSNLEAPPIERPKRLLPNPPGIGSRTFSERKGFVEPASRWPRQGFVKIDGSWPDRYPVRNCQSSRCVCWKRSGKQLAILTVEECLMSCSTLVGTLKAELTMVTLLQSTMINQLNNDKEGIPMTFRIIASSLAVILLASGLASAGDSPDEKRTKTRKMADQTLQELYKLQPTSQAAIQKSAGYAVFNNMGTNLLLVSTARGSGVAVNSNTKQETFMKMISGGAGLGVGVKDYRVIFVFENDKALAQFLDSGWSGSAQTDAAAKAGEKGAAFSGAVEVAPGVWVYQITKNGLALQLTLQGTKYYKDDDLNNKS